MTEAEVIAEITRKKNALEELRGGGTPEAIATIEEEIKKLEAELPSSATARRRPRRAFLDECAG